MKKRALVATLLIAAGSATHASEASPQDLAFGRDGDSIVVLTDARLGCKGIQQAYYVLIESGDVTSSGCYFSSGKAVLALDVQGKPHRWPLTSFRMTDYATQNRIGLPTAQK